MIQESGSIPSSNRKESPLPRAVEKESFLKVERGQKGEIMTREHIASGKVAFLRQMEGDLSGGLSH